VPEQSAGAIESEAPRQKTVQVYPRQIDLANVAKLAEFEATSVFSDIPALATAINQRLQALGA
jgi:flavoprotein